MKGFIVSLGRRIIDAYAFGGVLIGSLFAGGGLIVLILSLLSGGEKRAELAFNSLGSIIIGLLILVFIVLSTLFVYLLFDIRDHLADIKDKLEKYEKEKREVQP